ncbi:MAG: DHH family phosphoesterase [Lachnospiraceae bacterium]|nr:DHH family phosphoesterase [Lachnospiraceae bacterium]
MNQNKKAIGQQIEKYLRVPFYLSLLFIAMTFIVFFVEKKAGVILAVATLIYILITGILYYQAGPKITNELVGYIFEQGQIQKHLLKELSVPYVLVDLEGRILWSNGEFLDLAGKESQGKKMIYQVFPELQKEILPTETEKQSVFVEYKAGNYRVEMKRIIVEELAGQEEDPMSIVDNSMVALYFYDETALVAYREECNNQRLVAGLIYIDNYEEVLESIEEVRRPLMVALVERKITKYMQNIDAIIKKFEKDKYIVVFQNKHVEKLQETKFSILDEVRSINVGNELAVTLSIGLGVGAANYMQAYEYARVAMDLALGRGGDQAVVKDGEQIYYYGGKTQLVEKSTRVKARVKAHALREIVLTKDRVLVMGHKRPDVDSLGSAIGIYRLAKSIGKQAHIVINESTTSVQPIMNSLLSNHSIYGDDLFVNNEEAINLVDANTMLVVVDVNKPVLTECEDLLKYVKTIVVLDHHRQTKDTIKNAVLSYIEPYASSASEMVTEILQYIVDKPKLKPVEADALYSGMMIDTDNFVSKTGVRTFEAAAYLRRSGADVTRVRKLFRQDMETYKLKAEAVRRAQMYMEEFAIAICPSDGVPNPTVLGAQVANELLDIKGVRASFVLTDLHDQIYISARSIDNLNVQVIMEKMGGGGHLNMAATQLSDCTIMVAMDQLKMLLYKMKEEGDI